MATGYVWSSSGVSSLQVFAGKEANVYVNVGPGLVVSGSGNKQLWTADFPSTLQSLTIQPTVVGAVQSYTIDCEGTFFLYGGASGGLKGFSLTIIGALIQNCTSSSSSSSGGPMMGQQGTPLPLDAYNYGISIVQGGFSLQITDTKILDCTACVTVSGTGTTAVLSNVVIWNSWNALTLASSTGLFGFFLFFFSNGIVFLSYRCCCLLASKLV